MAAKKITNAETKMIMGKVLRYIKKYMPAVVLSLLLAGVVVVLTLMIPILTGNAVDLLLVGPGNISMAAVMGVVKQILIVMLVTAISQWAMNTCNNYITFHVVKDIRDDAIAHIEQLPLSYLDTKPSGDIVSRVIADADTFADGLLMGFTQLFTGILTIGGTLIFMLRTSFPIALVVVCVTPVSFLVAKFIATHTHDFFQEQSKVRGEQTSLIMEMVGNQKIVKTFGRESAVSEEFGEINGRLHDCSLKAVFYSSLVNPCTRFVNSLVYAGVAILGGYFAIRGGISIGQLSCFLSYANQYTKPFNEISGVITELQNAIVCAGRVLELIEAPVQTPDKEDAKVLSDCKGLVEIENVDFSYVPEKPLIKNLNLQVEPGKRVAIVGPTGCGKTTVINLLMRFYDVNTGKISVDGTGITDLTRGSLRTNYGMVLQETWLKNASILDNIRMGKPEATLEEVIAAAKQSHAHSFIKRLPKGYDTMIGEDGGLLSQGQKQLLCITRVMLCLPPMLILDEATSSIDTRTEIRIQRAFAKMMKGRTSFVVAHRLSTIRESDIILVMKDGNIIEQGNHESLLAAGGFYAELYKSQFAG